MTLDKLRFIKKSIMTINLFGLIHTGKWAMKKT
jgi:hypothetical protein